MSSLASRQNEVCPYSPTLEEAAAHIEDRLRGDYRVTRRTVSMLLLQGDRDIERLVEETEPDGPTPVFQAVREAREMLGEAPDVAVAIQRRDAARVVTALATDYRPVPGVSLAERLSRLCMSPITGFPILALVLWFGLYQFVGVFGGKTLVDLLENGLFGKVLNPWMTVRVERLLPWHWLSSLFVGEYGIWTLGVTYAVALIFPIVGTFFLAFSVLEDTGYLPRLAMLIDRLFKSIGLNGKAVIPMVLGFGCDTMATIGTRILETRRERIIATFLIAAKTFARLQWYFMEVFPLFIIASIAIWAGQLVGLFSLTVRALVPVVHLLGLPDKTAEAFLFGFFRRDYGAAGLYRIQQTGMLTGSQLLVCVVTLTIFLPCIAQFMMVKKEQGTRMAWGMAAFIFPFAIAVGALLNVVLTAVHARL